MDPREAGIRYWLQPIWPEDMPALATDWLAAGMGGDAVLKAASSDFMETRDIRDLFIEALKEVDAWQPSHDAAALAFIQETAMTLAEDESLLPEKAELVQRLLDFDDIAFGSLPQPYVRIAFLCWFYGGDAFEQQGGLKELRAALREAVGQ